MPYGQALYQRSRSLRVLHTIFLFLWDNDLLGNDLGSCSWDLFKLLASLGNIYWYTDMFSQSITNYSYRNINLVQNNQTKKEVRRFLGLDGWLLPPVCAWTLWTWPAPWLTSTNKVLQIWCQELLWYLQHRNGSVLAVLVQIKNALGMWIIPAPHAWLFPPFHSATEGSFVPAGKLGWPPNSVH